MIDFELEPVDYYCQHCDSIMERTGCVAPICTGYRCLGCGHGCDLWDDDDGICASEMDHVPYRVAHALREERRNLSAFGRPVTTVYLPGECS